jgi:hypothetical protein
LKVRHVPIQLEDGKIVRHDPDETMEIRWLGADSMQQF